MWPALRCVDVDEAVLKWRNWVARMRKLSQKCVLLLNLVLCF